MNDHNLDDLIIDNISPKTSKTKNFLTLVALAIVVLIIAIILTKIILKDPQSQSENIDENSVYISPDLTLESIEDSEKEIVRVPHIPTTEEVKPEISMPDNTTVIKNNNPMKNTHRFDNVSIDTEESKRLEAKAQRQIELKEAQRQIELKEAQRQIELKEAQRQIELSKASQEKDKQREIREAKRKKENATKVLKERAKKATIANHTAHPYFIQVGSFSKSPSSRFLNVITKNGFNYQITTRAHNRNKKLLIGPYNTKSIADIALVKVKDRINKNAFIIRK